MAGPLIDAAGNKYGGSNGTVFGDIVQDSVGNRGSVTKIIVLGFDSGNSLNSDGSRGKNYLLVQGLAGQGAPANQANLQEYEVDARQVTIISHADGTGLVSGGAAITQAGTVVPTLFNYFM